MKLSIVIPCYNEEESLPELFRRLEKAVSTLGYEWEVICVDDGSRDRTWELLVRQQEQNHRWCGVRLSRNFGHQTALSAGLCYAHGDVVAVMDADLQDPPEELGRFLEKWRSGYEVVYAVREKRKEGLAKRICYWGFYRVMSRLVSFEIPIDSGDFCVMDRKIVKVLRAMPERNRFVRGLRAYAGFRQVGIRYDRPARMAGDTKYSFRKLVKLAMDGILSFSAVPLDWVASIGFGVSFLSMVGMAWALATKIFKNYFAQFGLPPVQGFTTVVISILFLGGVQLMSLGLLGQYIARIFDEVKQRPTWVIQELIGGIANNDSQSAQPAERSLV